jgi:hypothetical protein
MTIEYEIQLMPFRKPAPMRGEGRCAGYNTHFCELFPQEALTWLPLLRSYGDDTLGPFDGSFSRLMLWMSVEVLIFVAGQSDF